MRPKPSPAAGSERFDLLQRGRSATTFDEVAAPWTTPDGQQGAAQARPLTAASSAVRTYAKPPRSPFQPLQDTAAFAACP